MKPNGSGLLEIMCTAIEIKEKMKTLYADAAGKCKDHVGSETFQNLRDMEQKHLERLRAIYADLAKGADDLDSCRFYDFGSLDKSKVAKKIGQKREGFSQACLDDVAAIEGGMELENSGIEFFLDKLKAATVPTEREFLNHMIAEERSHYIMLADLRFYYIDPGHWFMEKAKTGLDGA
jgi:rubrerythrin